MKNKVFISMAQIFAIGFISRILAFVTYSAYTSNVSEMWNTVAAVPVAVLATLLLLLPLYLLYRSSNGLAVTDIGYKCFGKAGGAVIAIIYGLYFLWVTLYTLSLFNLFVTDLLNPTISAFVLSLAVVAASVYGAYKGIEAISRASTVVFVLVIAALIFLVCTLLPKVDSANLYLPSNQPTQDFWSGSFLQLVSQNPEIPAAAMLLPFVKSKRKNGVALCGYIVFSYFVIAVLTTLAAGVLGDYLQTQVFPVYTLTAVAGFGVLERLDGVFLGVWTAGMFIKMSLFIYLLSACVKRIFGDLASRISILICGGAVLLLSSILGTGQNSVLFSSNILLCFTLLVTVAVPAVLLVTGK